MVLISGLPKTKSLNPRVNAVCIIRCWTLIWTEWVITWAACISIRNLGKGAKYKKKKRMTFVILWSAPPPPSKYDKRRWGVQKSEKIFFAKIFWTNYTILSIFKNVLQKVWHLTSDPPLDKVWQISHFFWEFWCRP